MYKILLISLINIFLNLCIAQGHKTIYMIYISLNLNESAVIFQNYYTDLSTNGYYGINPDSIILNTEIITTRMDK